MEGKRCWGCEIFGTQRNKEDPLVDAKRKDSQGLCEPPQYFNFVPCGNFKVLPSLKLVEHGASDRAFTYYAQDFSEGELSNELFAIRFANNESFCFPFEN